MKTQKRTKFAAMGLVVLVLVLGAIGFTGWFVYHSNQLADASLQSANKVSKDVPKVTPITTFDACKRAAGSKLLETYPEQCVTKAGKKFTNATSAVTYLVIAEWQVRIPLKTADVTTATYTLDSAENMVHITTPSLASAVAKMSGCHTGMDDVYLSRSKTRPAASGAWGPVRIGAYYYYRGSVIEPLCVSAGDSAARSTIQGIQDDLEKALPLVEAN